MSDRRVTTISDLQIPRSPSCPRRTGRDRWNSRRCARLRRIGPTVLVRGRSCSRKDLLATLVTIGTLAPRLLVVDEKVAAGILLSQEDRDALAQVGAQALGALIALEYAIKPVRHSLLERWHHVRRRVRNDDTVNIFGREVCRCAGQKLSAS